MLFAILGCAAPTLDEDVVEAEADAPSPYIYDEEPLPQPELDLPAIEAAMAAVVEELFYWNAAPVLTSYSAAMEGQSGTCPAEYANPDDGGSYWADECESDVGTAFSGYGYAVVYDALEADGYSTSGEGLFAVAQVMTSEGHIFSGGGSAYWLDSEALDGSHWVYQSILQGGFTWDGPEAAGTWLADSLVPDMTMSAYYSPDTEGHFLAAEGGIYGFAGAVDTVVLSGVQIFDEAFGSNCPIEPTGTLSARTPEGEWFDAVFDGPEWGTFADYADCDGCGQLYWRGEAVGEVCLDFGALLTWDDRPW